MNIVELGTIANVSWGDTSVTKKSYVESGYPAYSAKGQDGFLADYDFDETGIVLSAIGARCGKCFKATGRWKAIKNTITITAPKDPKVDIDYLFYIANDEGFWPKRGVAQPFIGLGDARKVKIPLPPLEEQKRIAKILDAADALRAKRRESLAQLDTLLQSVFLDMFGDPVTNPKGWRKEHLEECLESIDSGWSPKCLDRKAGGDEWGVLKLGAVTWCEFNEEEQKALPSEVAPRREKEVHAGDLLFSRKNTHELVAAAAYVHDVRPKLMLSDLIFRLRPRVDTSMESMFLWQLLIQAHQRQEIQKLAGGAAGSMPNISKAKLRKVKLIQPPMDLQKRYASLVELVEHQKTRLHSHLNKLDALFASLQSRAFNGEL